MWSNKRKRNFTLLAAYQGDLSGPWTTNHAPTMSRVDVREKKNPVRSDLKQIEQMTMTTSSWDQLRQMLTIVMIITNHPGVPTFIGHIRSWCLWGAGSAQRQRSENQDQSQCRTIHDVLPFHIWRRWHTCIRTTDNGTTWSNQKGHGTNCVVYPDGLFVCWSLTSLCHSNGHIETMPAREINPFTALTRIRSQFLRTQWSTSNHSEWIRLRLRPLSHRGWLYPDGSGAKTKWKS